MVLLTEGRGGRYEDDGRGDLTYVPSGREQVLYVGSRRGVPYHSKIGYDWEGERPPLPRSFSYLASGPPGPRLRQMLALSRAGVLRFLGADITITAEDGVFRARGASVPGVGIQARALAEARLPHPTVERTRDTLLRELYADGAAATAEGLLAVDPADGRVLDRSGTPHPRRFALGPHTDARGSGAFTRPRTGGPAFRQNDAAARAALAFLSALPSCAAS